jgi:hypothetical protein
MRTFVASIGMMAMLFAGMTVASAARADDDQQSSTSSQQDNAEAREAAERAQREAPVPVYGTSKAIDDVTRAVDKSTEADRKESQGK